MLNGALYDDWTYLAFYADFLYPPQSDTNLSSLIVGALWDY